MIAVCQRHRNLLRHVIQKSGLENTMITEAVVSRGPGVRGMAPGIVPLVAQNGFPPKGKVEQFLFQVEEGKESRTILGSTKFIKKGPADGFGTGPKSLNCRLVTEKIE